MKALFAAPLLLLMLATASAPAVAATNPSDTCAENMILVEFAPGQIFPQEIPSHGGCVSTVASRGNPVAAGDYSQAAYVAQCRLLEDVLPSELWNAPVIFDNSGPIPSNVGGFGGKIQTCTYLLKGYHSGTLTHPE